MPSSGVCCKRHCSIWPGSGWLGIHYRPDIRYHNCCCCSCNCFAVYENFGCCGLRQPANGTWDSCWKIPVHAESDLSRSSSRFVGYKDIGNRACYFGHSSDEPSWLLGECSGSTRSSEWYRLQLKFIKSMRRCQTRLHHNPRYNFSRSAIVTECKSISRLHNNARSEIISLKRLYSL